MYYSQGPRLQQLRLRKLWNVSTRLPDSNTRRIILSGVSREEAENYIRENQTPTGDLHISPYKLPPEPPEGVWHKDGPDHWVLYKHARPYDYTDKVTYFILRQSAGDYKGQFELSAYYFKGNAFLGRHPTLEHAKAVARNHFTRTLGRQGMENPILDSTAWMWITATAAVTSAAGYFFTKFLQKQPTV